MMTEARLCIQSFAGVLVAATALVSAGANEPTAFSRQTSPSDRATIRVPANAQAQRGLVLLLYRDDGQRDQVSFIEIRGPVRDERVLDFPCRAGMYALQSDDLVSVPFSVNTASCDASPLVTLAPAATLRGTVVVADAAHARPLGIPLAVRRCGGEGPTGEMVEFRSRVNPDGTFLALVPAGCIDALATPRGFAPIPIPSVTLAFRQVHDVGRLLLKPGATLQVRARSAGGQPVPGALVSVVQADRVDSFVEALVRHKGPGPSPVAEASTDDRGDVQFVGIKPDVVFVIARSEGRTAWSDPLELQSARMSTPEPIVPVAGGALTVEAFGDRRWMPRDALLTAMAVPEVGSHWVRSAFVVADLPESTGARLLLPFAGRWRVALNLSTGGRSTPFGFANVEVAAGGEASVGFSVGRVEYEGRVLIGDRTMAGQLTLVPDGKPQIEYAGTVDQAGGFRIWLPEEAGKYLARFNATASRMLLRKALADFSPGRFTTIKFEVSSSVHGVLTQRDGNPIAGAIVTAVPTIRDYSTDFIRFGSPPTVKTGEDGRFTFPLVEFGEWEIGASWNGHAAAPQTIVVAENTTGDAVRLVLDDVEESLMARLVDGLGRPVPGAMGRFGMETGLSTLVPPGGPFRTDADGYFTIKVGPYRRQFIQIAAASPGRGIAAFRVMAPPNEPLVVAMPATVGTLRITFRREDQQQEGSPPRFGLWALVNGEGALLLLQDALSLSAATTVQGTESVTVIIPMLPTGAWRIVDLIDIRSGLRYVAGGDSSGAVPLHEFTLEPGATVAIRLQ